MLLVYCLIIVACTARGQNSETGKEVDKAFQEKEKNRLKCKSLLFVESQSSSESFGCPPQWDGVLCWPRTTAGQIAKLLCPAFVDGVVNRRAFAHRVCDEEGRWYTHPMTGRPWTDYSRCIEETPPSLNGDGKMSETAEKDRNRLKCESLLNEERRSRSNLYGCPPNWDEILCWPRALSGQVVSQNCPNYVHGVLNEKGKVYRKCLQDGTWFRRNDTHEEWTDYTECLAKPAEPHESAITEEHIYRINAILQAGYVTSVITLVLASLTLGAMRRLRCPRNNLHIQLFLSFMLRGSLCVLKDHIFTRGNLALTWTTHYSERGYETWDCKFYITIWNYTLMANYSWILMEGLYLYNLIFQTMFTDRSNITKYVICGWCIPIPFVLLWAILRIYFDDLKCWTSYERYRELHWITRTPTIIFIVINFIFFVRIVRVLFINLRGGEMQKIDGDSYRYSFRGRRYKKLIKSTLILVPLFGAYHIIFVVMSLISHFGQTIELMWLYTDATCTSFQGFVVAVLYCLMNAEVHMELKRKWQIFKNRNYANRSKKTGFTNSLQMTMKTARLSNDAANNVGQQVIQKDDSKENRSAQELL